MPDIGDLSIAIGIQIPTTLDILKLSEVDRDLPDCVKQQIRQVIDLYKGDMEIPVRLARVLGIQIPDEVKAQAEQDLWLYGEAFFTKRDGQILYLPPETVIAKGEVNENGDLFMNSWHNYSHSIDVQIEPVELSHEQTLRLEDVVRIMRENAEREAAVPAGFFAWEDIGLSMHNPALSQLFAGEIGRMAGWDVMTPEQMASMVEGKDPPPSKKAVEWEERWHRKR